MPIDHGSPASSDVAARRERVLAMQRELATLEKESPDDLSIPAKRQALQDAYVALGVTGLGEQ